MNFNSASSNKPNIHEGLIDIYLSVKVRTNEEVRVKKVNKI